MKLVKHFTESGKPSSKYVLLDENDMNHLSAPDLALAIATTFAQRESVDQIASWTGESQETVQAYLQQLEKKPKKERVKAPELPYDAELELQTLSKSADKKMRILAIYWITKDLKLSTRTAFRTLFSPLNMRAAKNLEMYPLADIKIGMEKCAEWCKKKNMDWGLMMVQKFVQTISENK